MAPAGHVAGRHHVRAGHARPPAPAAGQSQSTPSDRSTPEPSNQAVAGATPTPTTTTSAGAPPRPPAALPRPGPSRPARRRRHRAGHPPRGGGAGRPATAAPIAGADGPLQRDGQGLDDRDLDSELSGAGRHLQADEPGADHHGPARHRPVRRGGRWRRRWCGDSERRDLARRRARMRGWAPVAMTSTSNGTSSPAADVHHPLRSRSRPVASIPSCHSASRSVVDGAGPGPRDRPCRSGSAWTAAAGRREGGARRP